MTKKIEDGGPAFPQLDVTSCERDGHGDLIDPFTSAAGGMSLRAYIATKAMAALISRPVTDYPDGELPTLAETAADAVGYADALLEALAGEV